MNWDPVAPLWNVLVWFSWMRPLWYWRATRAVTPEPVGLRSTWDAQSLNLLLHEVKVTPVNKTQTFYCLLYDSNTWALKEDSNKGSKDKDLKSDTIFLRQQIKKMSPESPKGQMCFFKRVFLQYVLFFFHISSEQLLCLSNSIMINSADCTNKRRCDHFT